MVASEYTLTHLCEELLFCGRGELGLELALVSHVGDVALDARAGAS